MACTSAGDPTTSKVNGVTASWRAYQSGVVGRRPQPDATVDRLEVPQAARQPPGRLVEVGPEEHVDLVPPPLREVLLEGAERVEVLGRGEPL